MNFVPKPILILFLVLFVFTNCNNRQSKKVAQEINFEVEIDQPEPVKSKIPITDEDVVFYNIFSPVDMSNMVSSSSAYFNSSLLNSITHITKYSTSTKTALNLGVYGADLSYLWMFKQSQQALSYLSAIQRLSEQLGIPGNFVSLTAQQAESQSEDVDSLIEIARLTYYASDRYLKGSDRENAAVLILLGGWIETLFIATQMYDQADARLASKIASQKFSLNSLINLLQNHQDNLVAAEYLLLLKKLRGAFNAFEIKFMPNHLLIDTTNKQITIKNSEKININPDQLEEIKRITAQIRRHIVE